MKKTLHSKQVLSLVLVLIAALLFGTYLTIEADTEKNENRFGFLGSKVLTDFLFAYGVQGYLLPLPYNKSHYDGLAGYLHHHGGRHILDRIDRPENLMKFMEDGASDPHGNPLHLERLNPSYALTRVLSLDTVKSLDDALCTIMLAEPLYAAVVSNQITPLSEAHFTLVHESAHCHVLTRKHDWSVWSERYPGFNLRSMTEAANEAERIAIEYQHEALADVTALVYFLHNYELTEIEFDQIVNNYIKIRQKTQGKAKATYRGHETSPAISELKGQRSALIANRAAFGSDPIQAMLDFFFRDLKSTALNSPRA